MLNTLDRTCKQTIMIDGVMSQQVDIATRVDVVKPTQPEKKGANGNIYRYKLSQQVSNIIERFAIIHRDDDTDDFKEAWERFCSENKTTLDQEGERLASLGCKQDFQTKIYTSARYYYKNKNNEDSITNCVPKKQREYNKTDGEKLLSIDVFIKQYFINNIDDKPETMYNQFVREKGDDYVSKKVFKNKLYVYLRNREQTTEEQALIERDISV
tara:strand:- start:2663 stop:3301 length:639 start_codon:yes stop_codon:yes gene_type:complete